MASKKSSAQSVELSSEPFFDKHCAVCSKSGRHVEAEKTCLDCRQTLCGRCLSDHDKFDAMKGHRVVDKAMSIRGHMDLPTQMCDNHSSKLIDMFCPQHDRVCCTACIATNHRRCDDVEYIPTISGGTKTSPEIQTVLKENKATLTKLQQRRKERENDKKRVANEKNVADNNAHESAQSIIKLVNDLKQKSLQNIQQKFNDFTQKIDEDCKKINEAITALENDIKELQTADDNESQLFVVMKQSKVHEELGAKVNISMGTSLRREALHFNADHDIEANIKKRSALGELETPFCSASVLGQYSMRLKKDQNKSKIRGICLMPDETILATDTENEKLKRLDKSYNHIDHCKLPGRPFGICRTGPTEVAIILGRQHMIQFVSVTAKLTPTRSFSVGAACRGIAYSRGQLFITCGGYRTEEGPGEVRVYNTDGKLLHNLPQKSTSQQFWSCPLRIALAQNGSKIIVTDENHGIVTMDRKGSNVNKNPLDVDDLCVQDQSLWFIGGNTTKHIFQVNNDGSSLGALLTEKDGLHKAPTSMSYQRDCGRLIVGFYNYDFVKVFQLYRK